MRLLRITGASLVCMLLLIPLGGCTFPVTHSGGFEVHFGRPQAGDVLMVGESMDLLANGSSTAGAVTRVLFFANGVLVGTRPNSAGEEIIADQVWSPSEPGAYTLQIGAQRDREYAYSPTISICVLPFQIAAGHPIDIYAHGYSGDCLIPDRAGSAVPGEPEFTTISANPQSLNFVPYFYDRCPEQTRVVSFKVNVDDPHDDVAFAAIALQISPALASRINSETTLALTHVGDVPAHTKLFVGSIDMHIFLAHSLTTPSTGEGVEGDLNWTARLFGRDGEILLADGPFNIPANPVTCEGSSSKPEPAKPVSTLELPTSTPASALDCPPGTYYADVTQKCIAIQIPPTHRPGNGGEGCSQYGSKDSCTSGGCSWDPVASSCQ